MTDTRPIMIRPYIEDARIGDGFRTASVLRNKPSRAVLFVPSLLTAVEVPPEEACKAWVIAYRPRVIRHHILARARMMRIHGRCFDVTERSAQQTKTRGRSPINAPDCTCTVLGRLLI